MLNAADKHYLEKLKQKIISNCPKCQGYGTPCECQDIYDLEVKKAYANIPLKYRDFTLNQINMPEAQKAKAAVKIYMDNLDKEKLSGRGLYLWSYNKGTAKTVFSCLILIEALKKGYSAYFTDLDECISEITSGWFDEEKRLEFEKRVLECDFLVVDDIGGMEIKTKGNSQIIATTLTTLFRKRSNALLPTILTSNLDLQEIDKEFGERFYSIICEHLKIIECEGIDYRKHVIARREGNQ